MRQILRFIRDNGLSIAFFFLFACFLVGQGFVGLSSYNEERVSHGLAGIGQWHYLGTGNFLDGMFSNWQAAILQLAILILFSEFLTQKGAPHSKKPGRSKKRARRRHLSPFGWMYRNSLFLAFLMWFLFSFVGHLVFGDWAYNEQRALFREPPIPVIAFFGSAKFWFDTLQTWEAEFVAIGTFMVLSVFLRQEGSAESKPVGSSNTQTGVANE